MDTLHGVGCVLGVIDILHVQARYILHAVDMFVVPSCILPIKCVLFLSAVYERALGKVQLQACARVVR